MDDEKRKGEKAIPDNVEDYLNELQQEIIHRTEQQAFWRTAFAATRDNTRMLARWTGQIPQESGMPAFPSWGSFEKRWRLR